MSTEMNAVKEQFMQGMGRMTAFWGFGEAMGVIYAALYLAPEPLALSGLAAATALPVAVVGANLPLLLRLGMLHEQMWPEASAPVYAAETDFWQVARRVLQEREQNEFGLALQMVGDSLAQVTAVQQAARREGNPADELAAFYQARLQAMQDFFDLLESLTTMLTSLDDMRLKALLRFFNSTRK